MRAVGFSIAMLVILLNIDFMFLLTFCFYDLFFVVLSTAKSDLSV